MAALLTSYAVDTVHSESQPPQLCRLDAGMLLRTTKDLWVSSLLLATVIKIRQQQRNHDGVTERKIDWMQISNTVFRTIVLELHLDQCWKMKPLMDGKAVIQALDLPKGPQVGTYLDEQVRWMLLNPSGSREKCQEHLLAVKRSLEQEGEQMEECLGKSDGTGNEPSIPVDNGKSAERHFSKKLHVENMEL
jgi:hypothetical protein